MNLPGALRKADTDRDETNLSGSVRHWLTVRFESALLSVPDRLSILDDHAVDDPDFGMSGRADKQVTDAIPKLAMRVADSILNFADAERIEQRLGRFVSSGFLERTALWDAITVSAVSAKACLRSRALSRSLLMLPQMVIDDVTVATTRALARLDPRYVAACYLTEVRAAFADPLVVAAAMGGFETEVMDRFEELLVLLSTRADTAHGAATDEILSNDAGVHVDHGPEQVLRRAFALLDGIYAARSETRGRRWHLSAIELESLVAEFSENWQQKHRAETRGPTMDLVRNYLASVRGPEGGDVVGGVLELPSSALASLDILDLLLHASFESLATDGLERLRPALIQLFVTLALRWPTHVIQREHASRRVVDWVLGQVATMTARPRHADGIGKALLGLCEEVFSCPTLTSLQLMAIHERRSGLMTSMSMARSEERLMAALAGRERLASARMVAAKVICRLMAQADDKPGLITLLNTPLFHYLTLVVLRQGEGCIATRQTIVNLRFLACSTSRSAGSSLALQEKVVERALSEVRDGLVTVGYATVHAERIVSDLRGEVFEDRHVCFESLLIELSPTACDFAVHVQQNLNGTCDGLLAAPNEDTVHERHPLPVLALGTWFLATINGRAVKCKLVWKGARSGVHVFVDCAGRKVLEAGPERLGAMLSGDDVALWQAPDVGKEGWSKVSKRGRPDVDDRASLAPALGAQSAAV